MTASRAAELLPCPFCGGSVSILEADKDLISIACDAPACPVVCESFGGIETAITAWNTRVPNAAELARVEREVVERCAAVAEAWPSWRAATERKHVSPTSYTVEVVKDIAASIRALAAPEGE